MVLWSSVEEGKTLMCSPMVLNFITLGTQSWMTLHVSLIFSFILTTIGVGAMGVGSISITSLVSSGWFNSSANLLVVGITLVVDDDMVIEEV